ncbi:hypothetical protein FRC12_019393 [Ceratobasidium sp. 428]|nr:hypothetical protein FRC12_019393 [Ceratobasidium sp. 428]
MLNVPAPVPTVQMDSMVADRASSYAASPAATTIFPKSSKKGKKKMTHREREAERQREEEARREEANRIEQAEFEAMQREAERERQDNARYSAEAAARAVTEESRRVSQRELDWERERDRLKAEEEWRNREPPRHAHHDSTTSSEWHHVQEHQSEPEQEDEEAYRARIEAARANVFGTDPASTQSQPRPRTVSTKGKSEKSSGKSSRPNSKVYPPTPAPKKFFESDLMSEKNGQSSFNAPNGSSHMASTPGYSAPVTPGRVPDSKAQVCNDVADLLGSFKRILDSEPDLLDAIRETFAHGPAPGALNTAFGNRSLSPEMLRIVSSVDDLLTKILPNRPQPSPYVPSNMELEPRIPTPSVTPTPTVPAEPEFGVPASDYGGGFEYANPNRGRQGGVPVINVPRPKYPASSLTREGYSTGTTPPTGSSTYNYARSTHASPERSAHGRSRSRPPPGDFEIVPPSHLPPQARMVIPPPVVPGEETDESPITPGFARQSSHEGGLVLADPDRRGSASVAKADMENARHHYKSQRELYKLEKAERKKEMEERQAAKAERKRAKAAANADPNLADLKNQLGDIVPPRPYEAERRYVENPYEGPRSAAPYSNSTRSNSTVYAEGLGQVTLMPAFPSASAVTAPVSPVREEATSGFERTRRRRQSMNTSPERFYPPPPSVASRTESYHGLQPDAYGAAHHAPPYAPAQPPQQDLAKRVALKLTEMGYTPQKYPTLPSIVGHRIRPIMNTHGVNENELAYLIVQDLFKYSGQN